MLNYTTTNQQSKVEIKDYLILTKPKIVVLLAITGLVAYLIPDVKPVAAIDLIIYLLLGYLSAGGAMAVNNAIDYDIDQKMQRTRSRVSTGKLSRLHVAVFGSTLMITGIAISNIYFGLYTSLYLAWGGLFYIFAYSVYLKRNSWLNTVVGGLASPAPVWGAYAARYEIAGMTADQAFLGIPPVAWMLGGLVFLWTPTHTWAMAVKNYDDYCKAEVPMLPVILGIRKTATIVLILGMGVIAYGLLIVGIIQPVSMIPSILISTIFGYYLIRFYRNPTIEEGTRNFHAHNIWLGILFLLLLF